MVLTAKDVSRVLAPESKEERTLLLKLVPGKKPEVTFTGLWSGKYVSAAIGSISRAYRVWRAKAILPAVKVEALSPMPQIVVAKEK